MPIGQAKAPPSSSRCKWDMHINRESLPTTPTPTGRLLKGRFQLVRTIGCGGSGTVYEAHDSLLANARVAIKQLTDMSDKTDADKAAFASEILMLSRMNNRRIVQFLEVIIEEDFVGYVMEYVEGIPLSGLIIPSVKLRVECIWHILHQLALAMKVLFDEGLIHRDLKPENVIITPRAELKLIDLGLAASMGEASTFGSRRSLQGTTAYLAPELLSGHPPSTSSDLFAFGLIAYRLIFGSFPDEELGLPRMLFLRCNSAVGTLPTTRENLPSELLRLIEQTLASAAVARPNVEEVIRSLASVRRHFSGLITFCSFEEMFVGGDVKQEAANRELSAQLEAEALRRQGCRNGPTEHRSNRYVGIALGLKPARKLICLYGSIRVGSWRMALLCFFLTALLSVGVASLRLQLFREASPTESSGARSIETLADDMSVSPTAPSVDSKVRRSNGYRFFAPSSSKLKRHQSFDAILRGPN